MAGRFEHFDARAGESYRMVLPHPGLSAAAKSTGDSDVVDARFVEVVTNDRVVRAIDVRALVEPSARSAGYDRRRSR